MTLYGCYRYLYDPLGLWQRKELFLGDNSANHMTSRKPKRQPMGNSRICVTCNSFQFLTHFGCCFPFVLTELHTGEIFISFTTNCFTNGGPCKQWRRVDVGRKGREGREGRKKVENSPSNCLIARMYGTPKLVLLTARKSSVQSLTICNTDCSSDLCCSIVFNIPFKSSILFRRACWLLKIFLTGMRFCSSPLEPSLSLSPLSDDSDIFLSDITAR